MDFNHLSLIKPTPTGFVFRDRLTEEDVAHRPFALLAPSLAAARASLATLTGNLTGIIISRGAVSQWLEWTPRLFHLVIPDRDPWPRIDQLRPHLDLLTHLPQHHQSPNNGQHKHLISELQATSDTLRQIIDTIPHHVFWKDNDLNYLGCNERFARAAGLKNATEIVGKNDFQLSWRETAELYRADDRRVIDNGTGLFSFVEPQSRPDGTTLWLETSKVPLRDDAGKIRGVLGIYQDISRRKMAEQRLEESERQLRVIFETSQAGIILVDPQGIITLANQSMAEMFRCPMSKLIGSAYPDFLHPQDKQTGDARMRQLIVGEIDQVSTERHYLQADGGDFWGYLSGKRLVAPDGKFQGLVGIITDINARRQSEEARAKMLAFVETLLAQSPLGIRVFDGESGLCIQANQAAAEIAGGSVEKLVGQNFRQLESWQKAGLVSLADEVLVSGEPKRVEAQLFTSFGKQEIVAYSLSRFIIEGHPNLLVLGQDITEEKRLDEENRRIAEQFLHAQKLESLGILAGGIAHDFNNILMSIAGNADLALKRISKDVSPVVNLERIKKATDNAANLARQMLAYSGKGKFLVKRLDLNHLLEETLHMLEVVISKKIALRLNLGRNLPAVEVDPTQLHQIIMNLVINASEAIGDQNGEITIATDCLIYSRGILPNVWMNENLKPGPFICLAVTDTGCGMDESIRTKLFDPFFTTKFTGRGLGMAAVQGIVRGHHGAIQVISEPGQGSTFKVLLPASDQPAKAFSKEHQGGDWLGQGQVLLVDDEEAVRNIGSEMLKELGFSVITAREGEEALAIFKNTPEIDFVILDLTMPKLDGEQCFRELRRIRPDVKVIMASGYSEQDITRKFIGQGLAGFIQKPYWLSSLRKTIQQAFKDRVV